MLLDIHQSQKALGFDVLLDGVRTGFTAEIPARTGPDLDLIPT
jgi:hypothetical protein